MMRSVTLAAMLATAVASMPVSAQTLKVEDKKGVVTATEWIKQGKHVEKITCKAFNGFDESFKPTAVTEAARYAKGKLRDETIDVAGIERVTPAVIEGCRANPDHTLVARIRQAF
jgi:hypothetical protein